MQILVFTRKGDNIPSTPIRDGLDFKYIKFETSDFEELLLIAKYRILNYPTSIIIDSRGRVLLKIRGSIPESYVDNFKDIN